MHPADAARSGLRLPAARPGLLPVYVLGLAAVFAARVPALLGLGAVLLVVAGDGRLAALVRELRALDPGAVAPDGRLPPGLEDALAALVTPTTVAIVGGALLAALAVWAVGQAVASAASAHAAYAALDGDGAPDVVAAGLRGIRDTPSFLGLALARAAALLGLPVAGLALGAALPPLLGVPVALLALVAAPVVYLALGFGEQAVAVDGAGPAGALTASLGFVRRRPDALAGYAVAGLAALLGLAFAGAVLAAANANALVTPAALVVAPAALDGFKTALYADRGGPMVGAGPGGRAVGAVRDGVGRLAGFAAAHPFADAAAAGLLVAGGVAGYRGTAGLGLRLLAPGTVEEVSLDAGALVGIWVNNWLVAATGAFGGVALGVPTATSLLLNGVLLGIVAGVVDPVAFLALVAPHGVIELPAIALAGSLGLVLGRRAWQGLRGRRGVSALADDVREGFAVLLGLGAVLLVAAAVETLVTPLVGSAVL